MDWTDLASDRKDGKIRLLSRKGKRLPVRIRMPLENAQALVKEGWAVVVSPAEIQLLHKLTHVRRYVFDRDGRICHYCGRPANVLDYRTPKCIGGHHTPDNCVAACQRCHWFRNDMPYDQFVAKYPRDVLAKLWDMLDVLADNGIEVAISNQTLKRKKHRRFGETSENTNGR